MLRKAEPSETYPTTLLTNFQGYPFKIAKKPDRCNRRRMRMEASRRNLISISFSQFGSAFSNNFIKIFLPFYILKISPYSLNYTLLWIGAIMGSAGLCAAATSTFWGSLTHRFNPKLLYLRSLIVNSVALLLMGFTTNLYILFLLRVLLGVFSGTSTIGLIIVSSSSSKEKLSSDLGFFQSSLTLGQLVGPLLGSLAAATLGYTGAFISASTVMFASFIFCYLYVMDVPRLPKKERTLGGIAIDKRVIIGWALCFTAMIQIAFLPSVLPNVFEEFNIEQTIALKLAGTVVMLYTATAMIGTYVCSWLSKKFGLYRMISLLFVFGILLQSLFAFSRGVVDFTVIRMVQTGLVAATFPLIISIFASESKGSVIGFLNSARYMGNALGPIIATSILAFSNLTSLYFFISGMTLFTFLCFKFFFK